jgi:hypothetical protein
MGEYVWNDYDDYTYSYITDMVFQIGDNIVGGLSEYKLAFVWVSDADGLPPVGERVQWHFSTQGGQAVIPTGWSRDPCSAYHCSEVVNGLLAGTYIGIDPWVDTLGRQFAVTQLIEPGDCERMLFAKFKDDYVDPVTGAPLPGPWPACLDVDDFACAAIVIYEQGRPGNTYNLTVTLDEGPIVGEIVRDVDIRFAQADPLDDPIRAGDADSNDFVNMGDVTAVERIVLGMAPMNPNADANRSGSVDMGDVTKIERIILGR